MDKASALSQPEEPCVVYHHIPSVLTVAVKRCLKLQAL